ncbi:MAG: hypothetical protein ACE5GA_08625 [Candidatus Zixiibacteriota bacterium]
MVDISGMDAEPNPGPEILREPRRHERCAFIRCCYLADELNCYGFMADCALYQRSNGALLSEEQFDRAVNDLIDTVRAKDQRLVD